ncbi:NosD domain-containing protein, partial [Bartonella bovis]|uniref:NosD domain-containing protein n=1 Tax=Bartonella bovis TaxID=155194 RepID=UPI0011AF6072
GVVANLMNVKIMGSGSGQGEGKGVIKDGTGTMKMTEVEISEVQTGIQVTSGNLTVNGGSMTGVQTGITMMGNGMLTVNGGTMTDVQTGITMMGNGMLTVNNGARITVKNGGTGLSVGGTATANLTNMTIAGGGATGTGVVMEGTGEMKMTDVRISKVEKAVLMKQGTVTMTGVQISNVAMG